MSAITAKCSRRKCRARVEATAISTRAQPAVDQRRHPVLRRRSANGAGEAPPPVAVVYNPKVRKRPSTRSLWCAGAGLARLPVALNAMANLGARNIASGLGFLPQHRRLRRQTSTLIPFEETDSYGRASWSGSSTRCWSPESGIVLATLLGFTVGIGRLSSNWLVARIAGGYVEIIRNLPLLFQILFWYLAVLGTLPGPLPRVSRSSARSSSTNRGFVVPAFRPTEGFVYVWVALGLGRAGDGRSRPSGETGARANWAA